MEHQIADCGDFALQRRGSEQVVPDTVNVSDKSTETEPRPARINHGIPLPTQPIIS